MAGNINAIGLILIVLCTILFVIKFGKKPTIKNLFLGILIFPMFSLPMILCSSYKCDHPNAFSQWLIPGVCLSILYIFRENDESDLHRLALSGAIIIVSFGLTHQYHNLVHSASYTAEGDSRHYNLLAKSYFSSILEAESRRKDIYYPSGFLTEIMSTNDDPDFRNKINVRDRFTTVRKFWHSSFTGIYEKSQNSKIEVWYPGGLLSTTADKIELREARHSKTDKSQNNSVHADAE